MIHDLLLCLSHPFNWGKPEELDLSCRGERYSGVDYFGRHDSPSGSWDHSFRLWEGLHPGRDHLLWWLCQSERVSGRMHAQLGNSMSVKYSQVWCSSILSVRHFSVFVFPHINNWVVFLFHFLALLSSNYLQHRWKLNCCSLNRKFLFLPLFSHTWIANSD